MNEELLNRTEVSKVFGVNYNTVFVWEKKGQLQPTTYVSGHIPLFSREDIESKAAAYKQSRARRARRGSNMVGNYLAERLDAYKQKVEEYADVIEQAMLSVVKNGELLPAASVNLEATAEQLRDIADQLRSLAWNMPVIETISGSEGE